MIGYPIDTFITTTSAANQKFVRKSRFDTSTCQCLMLEKLLCQSFRFKSRYFAAQNLKDSSRSKQRENEQVPAILS